MKLEPLISRLVLSGVLALIAAAPASSQNQDGQLWFKASATIGLSETLDLGLETNQRFSGDRDGLYESQYLGALTVELANDVTLTGGLNRVVALDGGSVTSTEWRPRQQVSFPIGKVGEGKLAGRLRIEQRFRSDDGETGHRVRPQLAYTVPLSTNLDLKVAHESYFNFNTTAFQDSGYERMRNSAEVKFPLADKLDAEVGYLNQYRFNKGERDLMEHALTTALSIEF